MSPARVARDPLPLERDHQRPRKFIVVFSNERQHRVGACPYGQEPKQDCQVLARAPTALIQVPDLPAHVHDFFQTTTTAVIEAEDWSRTMVSSAC